MSDKCSREPQDFLNGDFWYYENPGSILLIIPREAFEKHKNGLGSTHIRIPRSLLEASLKRMNASRRKRK